MAVGADEVWIDLAVSGFGVVDDEPAAALAAADGGFEVVVVDALAFAVACWLRTVWTRFQVASSMRGWCLPGYWMPW